MTITARRQGNRIEEVIMQTIQDVVDHNLCISCGACASLGSPFVSMREDERQGMFLPHGGSQLSSRQHTAILSVCPGKGYDINGLSEKLFPDATHVDPELGRWCGMWAARSCEDELTRDAASGGLMTAIPKYLTESGRSDAALVTGIQYGTSGPRPQPIVARTATDLKSAQGSKYAPSPTLAPLLSACEIARHLAVVGTPCQIAAVRMMQQSDPRLREKISFCIGNFCGGFRDLRETDTLIRRAGLEPARVRKFRYRGDGQPGRMYMEDDTGSQRHLPYPDYAKRTGFAKHIRCRLCVDATAELADFACGDAWLPRFLKSGRSWSILLARSHNACEVVEEMASRGLVELTEIRAQEVKQSQRGNLQSKKARQRARRRLYRGLGLALPTFDTSYHNEDGGILLELRVLATHCLFHALERLHLYPIVARAIGRYK